MSSAGIGRGTKNVGQLAQMLLPTLKEVNIDVQKDTATYTYAELVDLVTCVVCGGLMNEPHFIDDCEHMFCKVCIKELTGDDCPGSVLEPTCTTHITVKTVANMKRCKVAADIVAAIEEAAAKVRAAGGAREAPEPTPSQAAGGETDAGMKD